MSLMSVVLAGAMPAVAAIDHARPRLIAETLAARSGTTLALGVSFEIDDHWHLYWDGCNDSGFPIDIKLTLPDGWKAGDVQWPTPTRHIAAAGEVLDHVYEERVTLIIPVEVPTTSTASRVEIGAEVDWLVCDEACIPGHATLSIELPVVDASTDAAVSKDMKLFTEARAAMPEPWPQGSDALVTAHADGSTLVVTGGKGTKIRFYPRRECDVLVDRFEDPVGDQGEVRLRFESAEFVVDGVIEVLDARDRRLGAYQLVWPPAEPATTSVKAEQE